MELPALLGWSSGLLVVWILVFHGRWIIESLVSTSGSERLAMGDSLAVVFLVGLYDDYRSSPVRGLRAHAREFAHGRVTPGIVKVVGIVGAAAWAATGLSHELARVLLGIPVMAGAANVWNMLDVRPGRALKAFLVCALALMWWYARYDDLLLAAAIGSAAALLLWDLRERAMLGDAGSNVLGFVIGLGLYRILPTWGLAVALAVILALHALGETVTLSRLIEVTPPLRWFDQLGRLRLDDRNRPPREDSSIE